MMLTIRDQQMTALGEGAQAEFERQLVGIFMHAYPRECRQAGGEPAIVQWVGSGVRTAASGGYSSRFEVSRWLSLMLILGSDFANDPQLPWVSECLDPDLPADTTDRITILYERTLDYLGDTAGENAERVVRAMLRMRKIDFAAIPAVEDVAWPAECCSMLSSLYPEKFNFQGADLTQRSVRQFVSRARELGLSGPAGEFLYVLLAFMLGSGFDQDPLHPWAAAVLHQDAGGDRSAELEAAAREHLELSLASA